jgi:hypothetical protein
VERLHWRRDFIAYRGYSRPRRIGRYEPTGHEDIISNMVLGSLGGRHVECLLAGVADAEHGKALGRLLRNNAGQPLPQLWELIMGEVKRHGVQQDDQTLLLLRVVA